MTVVKDDINGVDSVRSEDLFQKPVVYAMVGIKKSQKGREEQVNIRDLIPAQDYVSVAGLEAYKTNPRKDPPVAIRLNPKSGLPSRTVIQEGHTRLGAALLRGESTARIKIHDLFEDDRGMYRFRK
jgi:hypothetical protein